MIASYLIDKSAYTRLRLPEVQAVVEPLLARDEVAVCPMVSLELLYSARSSSDYDNLASALRGMPTATMDTATWEQALSLQYALSRKGQHRRAIPDLLIAATGLQHGLVVLHYDSDFDLIADVSELRSTWVVERGTVN